MYFKILLFMMLFATPLQALEGSYCGSMPSGISMCLEFRSYNVTVYVDDESQKCKYEEKNGFIVVQTYDGSVKYKFKVIAESKIKMMAMMLNGKATTTNGISLILSKQNF